MFASSTQHAYKAGDKVRVRLRRDDVRFVAAEIVLAGQWSCLVNVRDSLVRVPTSREWMRKLALVKTETRAASHAEPRGAA